MAHDEGWEFIQLGKFLERADRTSRILDIKYHILSAERRTGRRQCRHCPVDGSAEVMQRAGTLSKTLSGPGDALEGC